MLKLIRGVDPIWPDGLWPVGEGFSWVLSKQLAITFPSWLSRVDAARLPCFVLLSDLFSFQSKVVAKLSLARLQRADEPFPGLF